MTIASLTEPTNHTKKACELFSALIRGYDVARGTGVEIEHNLMRREALLADIQRELQQNLPYGITEIDYSILDTEGRFEPVDGDANTKTYRWSKAVTQVLQQLTRDNPRIYIKLCNLFSAKTSQDIDKAAGVLRDAQQEVCVSGRDFTVSACPGKKNDFLIRLTRPPLEHLADFKARSQKIADILSTTEIGKAPAKPLVKEAECLDGVIVVRGALPLLAVCLEEKMRAQSLSVA